MDPADIGKGEIWIGRPGQHSIIWLADDEFTVYVHDGFTPGGHPIEGEGGGGGTTETVTGTHPIAVTELTVGTFDVEVLISDDFGNQIETRVDGLYVPPADLVPGAVYVDGDGISIDEVVDVGTVISARLSTDADNAMSIGTDGGLFATDTDTTYTGSETIDVSATEVIAAILDPEPHEYLQAGAGGLVVPPIDTVTSAAGSVDLVGGMAGDLLVLDNATPVLNVLLDGPGGYVAGQETTVVAYQAWTIETAAGVTLNGVAGPAVFTVEGLPDGVMFKRIGANTWLGLGDARVIL